MCDENENYMDWCQWCGEKFSVDPTYSNIPICPDCEDDYLDYVEANNVNWD